MNNSIMSPALKPKDTLKEELLNAPKSDYMNSEQLAFFKGLLLDLHQSTNERIEDAKKEIANTPELNDHNDKASWAEHCTILLRIVDREQKLLPKISQSLERIRLGTYGFCEETGEPIGIPRLLVRPTAEYCAEEKSVREMKEQIYRD